MNRDALVVGINQYPFLKDTPTSKAKHLVTPASDAEAIARRLEEFGGFRVRRLPEAIQDGERRVVPRTSVQTEALEEAIIQLFSPVGESVPQTALLYFAGHGLRKERGGVTEGFLAASDVNPQKNNWGVSLRWLRELLQKSPVRQQIVWLDCCFAGELLNFTEADLGTASGERTRFLIAAAREFELAEADIEGQHGVFSRVLWEGLDPREQPEGVVNNDRLIEYIDQTLKGTPQQPIWYNPNREILLTGAREQMFVPTAEGVCPYKGLRFFDVEDAPYFYGREALTEKLIERVQVGKENFLAVLGVSGSGKSSLLRAGLIYQLQQERRLPGTEEWKIRIFTPGEQPLASLATAFLDEDATDIERAGQLREAEEAIQEGATGWARLIKASKSPRTVLIVDQFEEVFTPSVKANDRQQFISGLLGALEQTGDKLCLIFAMRDDFLGKCAAYRELADLIQANLVMVTPMSAQELKLAIVEPATKLGRRVEKNLIDAILKDLGVEVQPSEKGGQISEPEPGMLPLLEYTLEQLWQRQTLNWLKLDSYNQLGGVRKTLGNLAEEVYKELSVEEQRVADWIFIKLTQLGEGTPDTRKQVPQRDLIAQAQTPELVEGVIQKLAQAKLIVTSEQRKGEEKVAVVDVAHEALIRYWPWLRELLDNNREAIRTERKIQTAAEEWRDKGKSKDYLLTGLRLGEAERFFQDEADIVPPSSLVREFVEESRKESEQAELQRKRRRRNTVLGLTGGLVGALLLAGITGWQWRQAQIGQIEALSTSSKALFSTDPITSLIDSLKAAKKLKQTLGANAEIKAKVRFALLQTVYSLRENNRLENHKGNVNDISFSPDNKSLASAGGDGTLRLWNLEGKELKVWWGDNTRLLKLSFGSDGKLIVLADENGMIKLWSVAQGRIIRSFISQQDKVTSLSFSPDGKIIASGSSDGSIKLWDLNGKEIRMIKEHNGPVNSLKFSPDGKIIASGSSDGSIKLWDLNGKEIRTIKEDADNDKTDNQEINSIDFDLAGAVIVSGSQDGVLRWWEREGKLIRAFPEANSDLRNSLSGISSIQVSHTSDIAIGYNDATLKLWSNGKLTTIGRHESKINRIKFSNDGKVIASASDDGTVKLWNLDRPRPTNFAPYQGETGVVRFLNFSPDGGRIVTGSVKPAIRKSIIKIWKSGSARNTFFSKEKDELISLSLNYTREEVALGFASGTIKIVNLKGKELAVFNKNRSSVNSLKFSPDSKMIVFGGQDGIVKLWRIDSQEIYTLGKHPGGSIQSLSYSPDGKVIASGGGDSTIRIWNLKGQELYVLKGHIGTVNSISFSPDGKIMASGGSDGIVKLWNSKGQEIYTLWGHNNSINSVSFHPDGKMLISGGSGALKLWLLGDSNPITLAEVADNQIIFGRSDNIVAEFSTDGKKLASTLGDIDNDVELGLWSMEIDDLQSQGCYLIKNYLRNGSSLRIEDRQLCEGVKNSAQILYQQGVEYAKKGNLKEAIAKFQEASDTNTNYYLDIEPEKEATYITARTLFDLAAEEFLSQNYKRVNTLLRIATELELKVGTLSFDPEERSRDFATRVFISKFAEFERYGVIVSVKGLRDRFKSITEAMLFPSANNICWFGSLNGYANEALDACEKLVGFESQPGRYKGIRGIAKTMSGDFEGAIEDFEANINWINSNDAKATYTQESLKKLKRLRQNWIYELRTGKNPIESLTPQEIETMSQITPR